MGSPILRVLQVAMSWRFDFSFTWLKAWLFHGNAWQAMTWTGAPWKNIESGLTMKGLLRCSNSYNLAQALLGDISCLVNLYYYIDRYFGPFQHDDKGCSSVTFAKGTDNRLFKSWSDGLKSFLGPVAGFWQQSRWDSLQSTGSQQGVCLRSIDCHSARTPELQIWSRRSASTPGRELYCGRQYSPIRFLLLCCGVSWQYNCSVEKRRLPGQSGVCIF